MSGRRYINAHAATRAYSRKPAEQLANPDQAANGPPIADFNKRLQFCPMIKRLREIGAPLFEDVHLRSMHVALANPSGLPLPPQFRRRA